MQVEQKMEAEFLRRFSRGDGVVEIIGEIGWRIEKAEPHPVIAVRLEHLQNRSGDPILLEDDSLLFGFACE